MNICVRVTDIAGKIRENSLRWYMSIWGKEKKMTRLRVEGSQGREVGQGKRG